MKIELQESKDHFFNLDVIVYQYPDLTEGYLHDRNWLSVKLTYCYGDQSWSITDPALLAWEVQDLATFFQSLLDNEQQFPACFITLDNQLEISCTGRSGTALQLVVSNYFVDPPEWLSIEPQSYSKHMLTVEAEVLEKACMELQGALQQYPVRPEVFG